MAYVQYHTKELNDAVDIKSVLERYGIVPNRKNMVHCPSPDHQDARPSASIKNNYCRCFACSKTFRPIDIVMSQEGVSFPRACNILIKEYGLNFKDFADFDDKIFEEDEYFPLNLKELDLLQWKIGCKTINLRDDEGNTYRQLTDVPDLKEYLRENEEGFYATMQEKCENRLTYFNVVLSSVEDMISYAKEEIKKICSMEKAESLFANYGKAISEYSKDDVNKRLLPEQHYILEQMYLIQLETIEKEKCEERISIISDIKNRIPDKYKDFDDLFQEENKEELFLIEDIVM